MTSATNPTSPSPDPGPSGDPTDPRALFDRAVLVAGDVIAGVPATALTAPTPSGMDVRELLEHLVMVLRRVACAGRGEVPWEWPVDAADVADDGFVGAWRQAAGDVRTAWADDALLERPTDLPWGTFSGAEVLAVYTNEITVHTWDLARGTGQDPSWDGDVLAAAYDAIHAQLPDPVRGPMWEEARATLPPGIEWEDPFADAVAVPDDAPLIDRLVAWNGRRP